MDNFQRFVALENEKRSLKERLEEIKAEVDGLVEKITKEFEQTGVSSVKTPEGYTVYIHRQLWAKAGAGGYEKACDALRMAGMGEFVQERFNASTLSAWVRELDRNGEAMPEVLRGAIDVEERIDIRAAKR